MSGLSEREREGCRKLLGFVLPSDLTKLHETVTETCMTGGNEEAIANILAHIKTVADLLKRRRVRRKFILEYVSSENITIPPKASKILLSKKVQAFLASNSKVDDVTTDASVGSSDDEETDDHVTSTSTLPSPIVVQESSTFRPSTQLNSPESASSHSSPVAANKPDRAQGAKKKSKDKGSVDLETFGGEVVSAIKEIKDPKTQKSLQDIIRMIISSANKAEQRASLPSDRQSTE